MNKKVLIGTLSAILIAGTGAITAFAATSSSSTQQANNQQEHHGHQWKNGKPGMRDGGPLNEIASVLGVSVQTLQSDLKAGHSIVDVATAQGKTETQLIDALKAQMQTRLDQAVKNGKLTQDKETQMLANFASHAQKFLEQKGGFFGGHHPGGNRGGQLNEIASVLGVSVQTLQSDLKAGQSIVDVATAQGKTETQLIDALKAQMQTHLDQAVKNGKLTQDKETQMLANFASHAQKFLEQKGGFPERHHPGGFAHQQNGQQQQQTQTNE